MLVERNLETALTLSDIEDIYCKDYAAMLLDRLRLIYQGRCFQSMMVEEVLELVRYSDFRCKSVKDDGSLVVHCVVRVRGVVFAVGEVIPDAQLVSSQNKSSLFAKARDGKVVIHIKRSAGKPNLLKAGDFVPIVVRDVRYNVGQPEVSVLASIMWPDALTAMAPLQLAYEPSGANPAPVPAVPTTSDLAPLEQQLKDARATHRIFPVFERMLDEIQSKVPPGARDAMDIPAESVEEGTVYYATFTPIGKCLVSAAKKPLGTMPVAKVATREGLVSAIRERYHLNLHNVLMLLACFDSEDKVMLSKDFFKEFNRQAKQLSY